MKGDLKSHWAVWVSGNWRATFRFDGGDAFDVDYLDYH
ncbi:MAG TPA: type II toxin-antitoxin system RelE/ParE family toxin [Pseudolabrys sp.]|nr:type II toxin-antitoxin system RelE/ParE family toxin [Pseudolabrys sp.]